MFMSMDVSSGRLVALWGARMGIGGWWMENGGWGVPGTCTLKVF